MSVSQICDANPHNKVIFTSHEGLVTRNGQTLARYRRSGGLYVAEMQVTEAVNGKPAGFRRQGANA
jgi:hypothetical protein